MEKLTRLEIIKIKAILITRVDDKKLVISSTEDLNFKRLLEGDVLELETILEKL